MNIKCLCLIAIILPFINCGEPEVNLKFGTIRGKSEKVFEKYIEKYLGIPYAKPPIGELRFAKPQELNEVWNDTLIADQMPAVCMQESRMPMSEDCLYLNIWTPSNRTANTSLPVMFWIHGGGLLYGSGDTNGSILSATTETVVVTVNYRLGAFGFLFGNSDAIPGNVGIYDQTVAMKWVHENIDKFGGDPNEVTIFGVSGGSWCVSLHLVSNISWPYFKNAIMMSGVAMDYLVAEPKDSAMEKAKALAKAVGCPVDGNSESISPEIIACLRGKDAKLIINAQSDPKVTTAGIKLPLSKFFTFLPIFGDEFVKKAPRKLWSEKHFKSNCNLLFGTVYNEFMMDHIIEEIWTPSDAMRFMSKLYIPERVLTDDDIEQLVYLYFLGINERKHRNDALQAATQMFNDIAFHCPSQALAESFSKIKSNSVRQYVFNYRPKNDTHGCDPRYPCHGTDISFTLGDRIEVPEDRMAAIHWMNILGEFAKYGSTYWPRQYWTEQQHFMPFYYEFKGHNDKNGTKAAFRHFRCRTWKSMALKD